MPNQEIYLIFKQSCSLHIVCDEGFFTLYGCLNRHLLLIVLLRKVGDDDFTFRLSNMQIRPRLPGFFEPLLSSMVAFIQSLLSST